MKEHYSVKLDFIQGRWVANVETTQHPIPSITVQEGATPSIALENLAAAIRSQGL